MYKVDKNIIDTIKNTNEPFIDKDEPRKFSDLRYDEIYEFPGNIENILGISMFYGIYSDKNTSEYYKSIDGTQGGFISQDGYEFCSFSRILDRDTVKEDLKEGLDIVESVGNGDQQIARKLHSLIVDSAARDPKIIEHIPLVFFLKIKTLCKDIFSYYKGLKLIELQSMPASQVTLNYLWKNRNELKYVKKTLGRIEKIVKSTNEASNSKDDKGKGK